MFSEQGACRSRLSCQSIESNYLCVYMATQCTKERACSATYAAIFYACQSIASYLMHLVSCTCHSQLQNSAEHNGHLLLSLSEHCPGSRSSCPSALQIKSAHRKYNPTMVFYVDRMDVLRRHQGDLQTLQMLTESIGSLWLNAILVLTHAGEPVPEGPQGEIGYETFMSRRTNALQQSIR